MLERGNFSVNKYEVTFSAIDRTMFWSKRIEQVKVLRSIKGIENNENTWNDYFLMTAGMGNIVESIWTSSYLDDEETRKREQHY